MRKRRVVGRMYRMKYSWKSHKDRNRHKSTIKKKRSGQAWLLYVKDINLDTRTTWRWAREDAQTKRNGMIEWAHPKHYRLRLLRSDGNISKRHRKSEWDEPSRYPAAATVPKYHRVYWEARDLAQALWQRGMPGPSELSRCCVLWLQQSREKR